MDSSGFWDQHQGQINSGRSNHEVQSQRELSQDEIRESIFLATTADQTFNPNHLIHAIDEENSNFGNLRQDVGFNQVDLDDASEERGDSLEGNMRIRQSGISLDDDVSEEDEENDQYQIIEDQSNRSSNINDMSGEDHPQPSLEQIQRVYYLKGLQELEALQLFDLSPLANWKLSSWKPGYGLKQLRDDSPDTYWQSDGSNSGNNHSSGDNNSNQQQQQQQQNPNNSMLLNQLSNPHSITIQFSKKVSLERISIFTNYSLDESYTPSKIKIMAGSSEGWDLIEVCTVNFDQPIGWSHIIFNGIRNDGVLKCFLIKIIIIANHQEGKDSHIRAIRCFGKKPNVSGIGGGLYITNDDKGLQYSFSHNDSVHHSELLRDLSLATGGVGSSNMSGLLLNNRTVLGITDRGHTLEEEEEEEQNDIDDTDYREPERPQQDEDEEAGSSSSGTSSRETQKIINNVSNIIGFNSGFQSLELKSISSIR